MTDKRIAKSLVLGAVAATLVVFRSAPASQAMPPFQEVPLKLNAALIVPDELMVGEGYKIDPVVVNDGYSNSYALATDWGETQAISDFRLRQRIQEIQALVVLNAMSQAGVFGDSLKEGVAAPLRGAKDLVTSPVQTSKGAVKGVGSWFGNIGRSITSDDPYQEGAVSATVGWAATKRAFALELGVDPNTDWEPLQQALVSVARAAFAGGITAGVAMDAVTSGTTAGTAITVTSLSADMNQVLLDNPPASLTKINRKRLKDMGIDNAIIDPFLLNYNYTPVAKTLLVEALRRMGDAKGRELFLSYATAAPDRVIARYMQQRAEMMASFHDKAGGANIILVEEFPWQVTRQGALVGVFPIDYLAWTEEVSAIVRAVERKTQAKVREIRLGGSASPQASQALANRGWTVKERQGLITGQPLQDAQASRAGTTAVRGAVRVFR